VSKLRFGRYAYEVEPVETTDGLLLPVRFILRDPRTGKERAPHAARPIPPSGVRVSPATRT